MSRRVLLVLSLAAPLAAGSLGCSGPGPAVGSFGPEPYSGATARAGTVVVEGCQLDPWQVQQLASPGAHALLQTVVLLCPTARSDGSVAPVEESAQAELAQQIASIRSLGYGVRVGVSMLDELDQPYAPDVMQASLASSDWRTSVVKGVSSFAAMADGVDLRLPPPPDGSRDDVTALVQALSAATSASSLELFVPPLGASTDVPGAGAYDLPQLGSLVARVHLETLDFSCCSGSPGPTLDPGWAVDVARAARAQSGVALDVAFPLYGWDFGPNGQRAVSYLEAQSVAAQSRATVQRGPTGALFYDWQDEAGGAHETWFDDGTSASWTLAAWDPQTLPADVGVVFWGLGSEDPALWATLATGRAAP
jgi:hypothetical protein